MDTKNSAADIAILIILARIWGTSFILMKKGLVVFSPGEVAALRVTVAGIILFPLAVIRWKFFDTGFLNSLVAISIGGAVIAVVGALTGSTG